MGIRIVGTVSFLFTMTLEEELKNIQRRTASDASIEFLTGDSKKQANEELENAGTFEELPDMFIRSDYTGLFDPNIKAALVEGLYENVMPKSVKNENLIAPDCYGITLLGAKQWVMVVDRTISKDMEVPRHWEDLFRSKYRNQICIQGKEDRFCGTLLLHTHKEFGKEGLKALAKNIKNVWHFTKMIKSFGKGNHEAAPITIMPFSNARMIVNKEAAETIWPEEGALSTPIYMLVKKQKVNELKGYIDYMVGENFGKILKQNHLHSIRDHLENEKFRWLDWDYISEVKTSLEEHKLKLNEMFKNAMGECKY